MSLCKKVFGQYLFGQSRSSSLAVSSSSWNSTAASVSDVVFPPPPLQDVPSDPISWLTRRRRQRQQQWQQQQHSPLLICQRLTSSSSSSFSLRRQKDIDMFRERLRTMRSNTQAFFSFFSWGRKSCSFVFILVLLYVIPFLSVIIRGWGSEDRREGKRGINERLQRRLRRKETAQQDEFSLWEEPYSSIWLAEQDSTLPLVWIRGKMEKSYTFSLSANGQPECSIWQLHSYNCNKLSSSLFREHCTA